MDSLAGLPAGGRAAAGSMLMLTFVFRTAHTKPVQEGGPVTANPIAVVSGILTKSLYNEDYGVLLDDQSFSKRHVFSNGWV